MKNLIMMISVIASLTLVGCGSSSETSSDSQHADHGDEHSHGDEHGHAEEGPHHGSLVELGNEEYHAEVIHDEDSGSVTIYLLDSSAKQAVPIQSTEILINLSHDGAAEQFTLKASPEPSDAAGQSSKFVSTDAELAEDLDHEGAEAELVVTIAGKQYRGAIQHDHHEGEDDHEHEHH